MASNVRGSVGAFGAHVVGSNVMALVRNESSTDALAAMLASCPPVGLPGQRGGMELDAVVSCGQKRGYYPAFEGSQGEDLGGDEDMGDDCMTGAHNVEKKRRLSFDQVRSLERNFEVENKLEPERKMQLAKELGLQPRQVAVWFQNRRARWKTKQLERDYEVLTSDYNRLKTDYDQVLQEKQDLQGEIECLTEKLRASPETGPADEKAAGSPKTRSKQAAAAPSSEAAVKKSGSRDTCSDSLSSEILDADSPRTMDSAPQLETKIHNISNVYAPASIPVEVPDSIIHMSDHLSCVDVQLLDHPRISVKLEDGSFQDESPCNYILTQLEEDKALPWWDWP